MPPITAADVALLLDVLPEVADRHHQAADATNPGSPEGRLRREHRETAAAIRNLLARLRQPTPTQEDAVPEPTYHLILSAADYGELLTTLQEYAQGASDMAANVAHAPPESPMGKTAGVFLGQADRVSKLAARIRAAASPAPEQEPGS
jgi:hypothetical protein